MVTGPYPRLPSEVQMPYTLGVAGISLGTIFFGFGLRIHAPIVQCLRLACGLGARDATVWIMNAKRTRYLDIAEE
jgi:hypothetical protein